MDVCCECCVLSSRGPYLGLITRPEESYRMWRVVVCDQDTSKTRSLKPATGLWKIQPQWVVTPGKQTNKQRNRRQFLRKIWPIQFAFLLFTVCRRFLSSLTLLCNTSSFLTWSVQLISILLQHQISKLSRYFRSAVRSVQIPALYKATLQL
jgi:hypothetical protein